jgi:hypothetical protein
MDYFAYLAMAAALLPLIFMSVGYLYVSSRKKKSEAASGIPRGIRSQDKADSQGFQNGFRREEHDTAQDRRYTGASRPPGQG